MLIFLILTEGCSAIIYMLYCWFSTFTLQQMYHFHRWLLRCFTFDFFFYSQMAAPLFYFWFFFYSQMAAPLFYSWFFLYAQMAALLFYSCFFFQFTDGHSAVFLLIFFYSQIAAPLFYSDFFSIYRWRLRCFTLDFFYLQMAAPLQQMFSSISLGSSVTFTCESNQPTAAVWVKQSSDLQVQNP